MVGHSPTSLTVIGLDAMEGRKQPRYSYCTLCVLEPWRRARAMGVVVPRLFQHTVKDVARPAVGRLWVDGTEHRRGCGGVLGGARPRLRTVAVLRAVDLGCRVRGRRR